MIHLSSKSDSHGGLESPGFPTRPACYSTPHDASSNLSKTQRDRPGGRFENRAGLWRDSRQLVFHGNFSIEAVVVFPIPSQKKENLELANCQFVKMPKLKPKHAPDLPCISEEGGDASHYAITSGSQASISESKHQGRLPTRGQVKLTPTSTNLRYSLIAQGLSPRVIAVLDTKVQQAFTLVEASDPIFRRLNQMSREPVAPLVKAVDQAITRHQLSLIEKRELFEALGWEFGCIDCQQTKGARYFVSSSYLLWEDREQMRPFLRCGPCIACKAAARVDGRDGNVVPYTA